MDPTLISPETLPGMPAPLWFVQLFKVIGFVLHMIPMGIWFAGLPVALGCALWNCKHSRHFARRLFGQLPVFMALGINFGIVPLLFLQTTYYKSFYTATILMAWHWLAIIPILIVGYYSLYLAAFSRCSGNGEKRPVRMILFGTVASLSLIAIGILIANGLTLMVRSDLWAGIMERTNYFGATTGLANNMRDPAVWLRLATMFSLGLMTTGVWAAFDSYFLMKNDTPAPSTPAAAASQDDLDAYRRWTFALTMFLSYTAFAILVTASLFGFTILKTAYPNFPIWLSFVSLFLVVLSAAWFGKIPARHFIAVAVLGQLSALALFGVIRQIGQNAGVASYVDVTKIPTAVQWSPLLAFLVCFVLGLLVIFWMVKQCITLQHDTTASGTSD